MSWKILQLCTSTGRWEANCHWQGSLGTLWRKVLSSILIPWLDSLAGAQDIGAMSGTLEKRIEALDWQILEDELWELGYAKTPPVLTPAECHALAGLYRQGQYFRKRVVMERHGYGLGEYQYFNEPLPPLVHVLRTRFYPHLALIANRWMAALGSTDSYPEDLERFLELCRTHGQLASTPLLLHYPTGGYNCLHRDLYGDVAFPLQLTCFLSEHGEDYTGGAFILVEQRPRAQSYGESIITEQGEILIFPTQYRPVKGTRGYRKTSIRHGSTLR